MLKYSLLLFQALSVFALAQTIDFPLPNPSSGVNVITQGPDGSLWFTEAFGNRIGRITVAGQITEFPIPTPASRPVGLAFGPDGNLWFTEAAANQIGKMTTAGVFMEFPIPTPNSGPFAITLGPDGNLWFTEQDANRIGRITVAGAIKEYPVAGSFPLGITTGPDGNLWFAEQGGNNIGQITPTGSVTEFPVPTPAASPFWIVSGRDGNLWFTEEGGNKIGRITPGGTITEFSIPTAGGVPIGITVGPDGNLWFAEEVTNKIGRITPSGQIKEFSRSSGLSVEHVTAGPDGNIWFTDQAGNLVGRLNLIYPLLMRYASSLSAVDSIINITNAGANGDALNGPGFGGAAGNVCANVYAFSPDEQLVSCCSCLITPNGLVSLSVNNDLISNTLTGVRPNSIVVKIVNTGAGAAFTSTACTNSAALADTAVFPLADGVLAWGTTTHVAAAGVLATTETPFSKATLSAADLSSITNRCMNIIGNGSTFGICRSCRAGGLNRE